MGLNSEVIRVVKFHCAHKPIVDMNPGENYSSEAEQCLKGGKPHESSVRETR